MSKNKEVIYPVNEDYLGKPKLFVDDKINIIKKMSSFTGIEQEKIVKAFDVCPKDLKKYKGFTTEEVNKIRDVEYLLSFVD